MRFLRLVFAFDWDVVCWWIGFAFGDADGCRFDTTNRFALIERCFGRKREKSFSDYKRSFAFYQNWIFSIVVIVTTRMHPSAKEEKNEIDLIPESAFLHRNDTQPSASCCERWKNFNLVDWMRYQEHKPSVFQQLFSASIVFNGRLMARELSSFVSRDDRLQ